ncbi:MAG: TfoX/Sxy family protein [Fibrobacterales bacterium]|nr:TfoX/Sxy family protein [Fibrobacterales bacterium]
MPSSRDYLDYVLDQLSGLDGVTHRAMMGEYILYRNGKVFGGVYDDRFLLKVSRASEAAFPDCPRELPYPGAREMIRVDCDGVEERRLLAETVGKMTG